MQSATRTAFILVRALPLLGLAAASAIAGVTTRASLAAGGVEGNSDSYNGSLSATGRFVVFESAATNFDPADPSGNITDIYIRDLKLDTTRLVSGGVGGAPANNLSAFPVVSKNGRIVAFESAATNLVAGDTNLSFDVFVRDMKTGVTTRSSVGATGVEGDKGGFNPSISDNGRFLAFQSDSTNLVAGDTNARTDCFVRDIKTGVTTRISLKEDGNQVGGNCDVPVISANGRFVTFESESSFDPGDIGSFQDVYVRDLKTGHITWESPDLTGAAGSGNSYSPSISGTGRFVTYVSAASDLVAGDGNGFDDIFVRDRKTGTTTRVSVNPAGTDSDSVSFHPALSGNGKFVAFESFASDLVAADANGKEDAFVRDLKAGVTTIVSVDSAGVPSDQGSSKTTISKNGRFVAFSTLSSLLVPNDGNGAYDVFLRDRK